MHLTNLVVFTLFLALALYDAFVVYFLGRSSNISLSVSRALERLGLNSPIFVFVTGCLIGHLLFSMSTDCSQCLKPVEVGVVESP